ncbi:MAG: hypothetical protein ACU837_16370 [Gammaproteobacteria bacterium]
MKRYIPALPVIGICLPLTLTAAASPALHGSWQITQAVAAPWVADGETARLDRHSLLGQRILFGDREVSARPFSSTRFEGMILLPRVSSPATERCNEKLTAVLAGNNPQKSILRAYAGFLL